MKPPAPIQEAGHPSVLIDQLLAAARAVPKPEILKALREEAEVGLHLAHGREERLQAQGALLLVELGERAAAVLARFPIKPSS